MAWYFTPVALGCPALVALLVDKSCCDTTAVPLWVAPHVHLEPRLADVLQYSRRASLHFSTGRRPPTPLGPPCCLPAPGAEAVRCAQAAHKPLGNLDGEVSGSPHSGMASPTGPLGAPRSSASDDGRGCDGESGDPSYAPVVRRASLSSCDSESAPALDHCLSGSGSGFSDAGHMGTRVRACCGLQARARHNGQTAGGVHSVPSARTCLQRLAPCWKCATLLTSVPGA